MMKRSLAGLFRRICAALVLGLLAPAPGQAATLHWSSLPDRERITITMSPGEGLPGTVGRIDLHGVLIPFSQVPSGLDGQSAPPQSAIFLGTRQLGRSLVLMTKTPEFGFVVSTQTPRELSVDFFPNALGARWKPSSASPVTELPPNFAIGQIYPDNAATSALAEDPAGSRNVTPPRVAAETGDTRNTGTAQSAPQAGTGGTGQGGSPLDQQPGQTEQDNLNPPAASGTSGNTAAPQGGNAPVPGGQSGGAAPAQTPATSQPAGGASTQNTTGTPATGNNTNETAVPGTAPSEARPFLDSRRETDMRTASLPAPGLSVGGVSPADGPQGAGTQGGATGLGATAVPAGTGTQPADTSSLGRERIAAPGNSATAANGGAGGDRLAARVAELAAGNASPDTAPARGNGAASTGQGAASGLQGGIQPEAAAQAGDASDPVQAGNAARTGNTVPAENTGAGLGTAVSQTAGSQLQASGTRAANPSGQAVAAPAGENPAGRHAAPMATAPDGAVAGQNRSSPEEFRMPPGQVVRVGDTAVYAGLINLAGANEVPVAAGEGAPGAASAPENNNEPENVEAHDGLSGQAPPPAEASPQAVAEQNGTGISEQNRIGTAEQPAQNGEPGAALPESMPRGAEQPLQQQAPSRTAGPADKPETEEGLSGEGRVSGDVSLPPELQEGGSHGGGAGQGEEEQQVLYVDEAGNPVDPPLEPATALPQMRQLINAGQYQTVLDMAEKLLRQFDLSPEQREEALHMRAEMLFAIHKDALDENFVSISDATSQAINFNQSSYRNAGALLRLGYINLRLGNLPEARARFNMLRTQFPHDENVPLTYYYWGDYYFNKNDWQKSADEFQYILQHYANSRYAREAALGLARSFYRMGYYQQAFDVVGYIERRWQRFYIDYPPFLNMMGDVAFRLNKLDIALKHYWTYVNIEPKGEETDVILTRIGDIYGLRKEKNAAKLLYEESVTRFPGKDGALVAMMRLAEEGANDLPAAVEMQSVFDRFPMGPSRVYENILKDHPESELAPLAQLKLAMWYLWRNDYIRALELCDAFLRKYPGNELEKKVKEVAVQAFSVLASESVQDGRYYRLEEVYGRFPWLQDLKDKQPNESLIALAISYRDGGNPDAALATVEPFFLGHKNPEYSEMALHLVLGIYLQYDQWNAVRHVARQVELWELTPEAQMALNYALALAAENLGESTVAAPLWRKLYDTGKLKPGEQTLAAFFLGRDAERRQDLEVAYQLGKEALSGLLEQADRNPGQGDFGKILSQIGSLMDVAERAGRMREALQYANQFLGYLKADNPDRAAILYRMARIYKRQGNDLSWENSLKEIIAGFPGSYYANMAESDLNSSNLLQNVAPYSPTGNI